MANRYYASIFDTSAVTAAIDLFQFTSLTTKAYKLVSAFIGQSSDAADAQDEMLRININHGSAATTSGTAGASGTSVPLDPGDVASSLTTSVGNTTRMTSGTITLKHADTWNVRAGWQYRPLPEERITFGYGQRLTIALPAAPADSLTMTGTAILEEIG